jgi:hypothetical protein
MSNPTTKEDLLALVNELSDKRDAADAAHAATSAAQENVVSVTTVEQGLIDAAMAHFDVATTQAKQQATDAQSSQDTAEAAEQSTFDELLAAIQNFKSES